MGGKAAKMWTRACAGRTHHPSCCLPPHPPPSPCLLRRYVHRSGRTGRAGAKGTCVTLYTAAQAGLVAEIEAATGNAFERIAAPQAADVVASGGVAAVARLEAVHAEAAALFRRAAAAAIASGKARGEGAETVLARALAVMVGRTQPPVRRSLLCSAEGAVTYAFSAAPASMAGAAAAWAGLKAELPTEAVDDLRGLVLSEDGTEALFDVPAARLAAVAAAAARPGSRLSAVASLPPLRSQPRAAVSSGGGEAGGVGGGSSAGRGRGRGGRPMMGWAGRRGRGGGGAPFGGRGRQHR